MTTTISDSVALLILNSNTILTGVGNELHLFTSHNDEKLILPFYLRGMVHGIESSTDGNSSRILVYGGKEFMILDFYCEELKFNFITRGFLTDWISSAKILSPTYEIAFITAHSVAINLVVDYVAKTCRILKKSVCKDKSTLYCSYILGDMWENLTVFGGNAFGELLVWKPFLDTDNQDDTLLHRIACHNGVIFSIDIDLTSGMLTTTSDDRSIRFWKLKNSHENAYDKEYWKNTQFLPFASGYGHKARVFRGKLIKEGQNTFAVTVAEDSYICLWKTNGELIFKRRQQFGAIIWNFMYDRHSKILFTIGSTGNLLPYNLKKIFDHKRHEDVRIIPKSEILGAKDYVAKVKFITQTMLVGLTNQNRMVTIKLKSQNSYNWEYVSEFKEYKCTLLRVFENEIVLAGHKRITIFKYEETEKVLKRFEGEVLEGVIRSFHFLAGNEYLICDDLGNCICVFEKNMSIHKIVTLPKCKEPWLTAAIKVENFYVLSNRQGNVFLYSTDENRDFKLFSTLKRVHGNLGVTTFVLERNEMNLAVIKSAGHDGIIRRLGLNKDMRSLRILSNEQVPVMWVENFLQISNTEYILGFNDNHFAVWSREQDFAFHIQCGGGHRCWEFTLLESEFNKQIIVTFIRNKELFIYSCHLLNQSKFTIPYKNDWHVKPCNTLQVVDVPLSSEVLVVSGGDDNLIKICKYCFHSKRIIQRAEIHTHISSVRTLKVEKLEKANYIIFSAGGRAQLCITIVDFDKFMVEEKLNFTLKLFEEPSKQVSQEICLHSETRIMTLDVQKDKSNKFNLFLGCSDGYMRKFTLEQNMQISLQSQVSYKKCVLHVRTIYKKCVFCATTDGVIHFLSENLNKVILEVQHHESGVNSLDILQDDNNHLHLITGGDDQSVVYSKISMENKEIFKVIQTKHFNIHSAQVTGLKLLPCLNYFFSVGIDQNLLKTNIRNGKSTEIYHTCIADVKGMSTTQNEELCFIYGCGLQVISIK